MSALGQKRTSIEALFNSPHLDVSAVNIAKHSAEPFCLRFVVVSHLSPPQKQRVAAKRNEVAQCTRINAVARAFLISTEGANCRFQPRMRRT
jgi:hypothetical protein